MPDFVYIAKDTSGRQQRGQSQAASLAALATELRQKGLVVIDISSPQPTGITAAMDLGISINPLHWLPIRSVHMELGLRQLATMLRGGLTLLTALQTVAKQTSHSRMRTVWRQISEEIQDGASLSTAMSQHRIFNRLVIQLTSAGEMTGILDQVLDRAAESLEKRRRMQSNLVTAVSYPCIVFVAAIAVCLFMMIGVIPKQKQFLTALGKKLPAITQLMLDISSFITDYLLIIGGGMIFAVVAVSLFYMTAPGRICIDYLLLRMPLVGKLLRLSATAMFARSASILIHSGVSLIDSLRTVEQLIINRHLARQVAESRDQIMRGSSLSEPLAKKGAFMPMLSHMVAVGEMTGNLDDSLDEVARFYELQLEASIRQLSAIIEPMIVILVGGIVGFIYIASFAALFAAAGR